MQPKSHTLFHFTKNLDYLKDILRSGFWPRYCLEDAKWYNWTSNDYYIAYPMVCFCDIPLSRVDEHVNFYGDYGIGVTRKWAESNGLSPVLYIKENSPQQNALKTIFSLNINSKLYPNAGNHVTSILSHIKPTEGTMLIGKDIIKKEFYQENEWRYTPNIEENQHKFRQWLSHDQFMNSEFLSAENDKSKEHSSLKIVPSDIKYLFVKSDSDIPILVNFIQTELDSYPSHDVKILLSRIISLETITQDL